MGGPHGQKSVWAHTVPVPMQATSLQHKQVAQKVSATVLSNNNAKHLIQRQFVKDCVSHNYVIFYAIFTMFFYC